MRHYTLLSREKHLLLEHRKNFWNCVYSKIVYILLIWVQSLKITFFTLCLAIEWVKQNMLGVHPLILSFGSYIQIAVFRSKLKTILSDKNTSVSQLLSKVRNFPHKLPSVFPTSPLNCSYAVTSLPFSQPLELSLAWYIEWTPTSFPVIIFQKINT